MAGVEVWMLLAAITVMLWVLWAQRRTTAQRDVDRLVVRGGLPPDPELVAAARKWYQRRHELLVAGIWIGWMTAGLILLLMGEGWDTRMVTWWIAGAGSVGGLATLLHGYQTVSRSDGPRTASLRPRQLAGYLSPVEIAIEYGFVLVPVIAGGLGIMVLALGDSQGWILVAAGLAGVALWGLGLGLQQMALRVNHTSGGEVELQWQEALRAATLRDVAGAIFAVCWLLGSALPVSFEWPADVPGFVEPLTIVVFAVSLILVGVATFVAMSRRGLGRVRRVAG